MRKECSKCGIEKPLFDFHVDKSKPTGTRPDCKACHIKLQKKRYGENPDSFAKSRKKYYEKNKSSMLKKHTEWSQKNPEKVRAYSANWRRKNNPVIAMHANKRRASKIQATPPWINEPDIQHMKDFYEAALQFRIYTGKFYEVDHIIPLMGETVCGLHVPWNMQIIEEKQNRSKKNKLIIPKEQQWEGV